MTPFKTASPVTLLLALAPYGVASADVLAFSFLVFGVTVLGVALFGGVFEARRLLTMRRPAPGA